VHAGGGSVAASGRSTLGVIVLSLKASERLCAAPLHQLPQLGKLGPVEVPNHASSHRGAACLCCRPVASLIGAKSGRRAQATRGPIDGCAREQAGRIEGRQHGVGITDDQGQLGAT
jgi:hypothetical protein